MGKRWRWQRFWRRSKRAVDSLLWNTDTPCTSEIVLNLDEPARKVFFEIQQHKAMPFLEIAAVTGVRGSELKRVVKELVHGNLVTLSKARDLADSIVSISGKYF